MLLAVFHSWSRGTPEASDVPPVSGVLEAAGITMRFAGRATVSWMTVASGITLGFFLGMFVGRGDGNWLFLVVAALFAITCITNVRLLVDDSRWDEDGVLIVDRRGGSSGG